MTLHIAHFTAENYKRIKAVDITPEGNIVFIGGKNAQGKTSVLDAIWAALAGGDASRAIKQPIRDGEKSARVRLDLGEIIVTRRWTKDDVGTLTVESADGARYGSPQKMLDELIGARAFDPLEFVRQKPSDQVATLLSMVELPFDVVDVDRKRAGAFETRTEVNRSVKALENQLAAMVEPDTDVPQSEVNATDILAELTKAQEHNTEADGLERAVERAQRDKEEADAEVLRLSEALEAARAHAADAAKQVKEWVDKCEKFERIDLAAISARLETVQDTNRAIREAQDYRRVTTELAKVQAESDALTKKLEAIDKQKAEGLAAAKFPVEGLSFDSDGVTFNGVPFSQASAAEQLRVSVALAMAANPKLRVLRILDGSLLDSDSQQIIAELAAENDYQVWIEVVDESGKVGVVIEDGQVRA